MNSAHRALLLAASLVLSILLLALLIRASHLDLRAMLQQLGDVRWPAALRLLLLNVLLILVSTEKWRRIDDAWRSPSDAVQPRSTSFALTSLGFGLGVFLPVQIAMSAARTLGTFMSGSAIKRGTAGTLYEQSFDLGTVGFFAIASGIAHYTTRGIAASTIYVWTITAATLLLLALGLAGSLARLIRLSAQAVARALQRPEPWTGWCPRFVTFFLANQGPMRQPTTISPRLREKLRQLSDSPVLSPHLARQLILLSAARFFIVVLMSVTTATAIGLQIPFAHMTMAIPFVVMASVIALTPGGLGINELAGSGALTLFGTPFALAARWSIANRLLITASYLSIAIVTVVFLSVAKLAASTGSAPCEDH